MSDRPRHPLAAAAPALGVLLLVTLPFVGRAHSIDAPLYLDAARQVLAHPLDPLGGGSFWHDRPATLFDDLYNPPLTAYLLALPVALDGGSEASVQLLMLLFAALALFVAVAAGSALGVEPRWSLLLAASPVLAVSSLSAMTDVPFLLLTLASFWAALRSRGGLAGALVGLSALTKYSGLLNLVPVALTLRGRERLRALTATAAVFGVWCLWNLVLYGRLHVRGASRFLAFSWPLQKELLLSFVASLGLAGLPAAVGLLRWSRSSVVVAMLSGIGGAWLVQARTGSAASALLACAAFGSGSALLLAAIRASLRLPSALAASAFWLHGAYGVVLVYFGAARYALPLLAPLMWLLVGGRELRGEAPRLQRWTAVAAGILVSLMLLAGEAGYAGAWRELAARLPVAWRGFEAGHWGFQWYARRAGYAPLDPRQELVAGDRVAEALAVHGAGPAPAQAAVLEPGRALAVASPLVRVMDRSVGAGFYSSDWGLLPFGLRRDATEVVRLRSPAAWVLSAAGSPPQAPVVLDLGSPEARHTELDGWSGNEGFDDAGARHSFVWMVGPEAALRVPLPPDVRTIALRAFPSAEAAGPLRVELGPTAHAVLVLQPGWRSYEAPVEGVVAGGPTTVVLRPAGHRRPGPLDRERRELSVAIDLLAFGAGAPEQNRGVWPVATAEEGAGLLVAGVEARLGEGHGGERVRMGIVSSDAALLWRSSDTSDEVPLWLGVGLPCAAQPEGCVVDARAPGRPGRLVLRAGRAIVSDLEITPP